MCLPWHTAFSGRQWVVSEQNKGDGNIFYINKNIKIRRIYDSGEVKKTMNHII